MLIDCMLTCCFDCKGIINTSIISFTSIFLFFKLVQRLNSGPHTYKAYALLLSYSLNPIFTLKHGLLENFKGHHKAHVLLLLEELT
jgi:hypothetical protein